MLRAMRIRGSSALFISRDERMCLASKLARHNSLQSGTFLPTLRCQDTIAHPHERGYHSPSSLTFVAIYLVPPPPLTPLPSAAMLDERARIINPIVPESVQHNARVSFPFPSYLPSLLAHAKVSLLPSLPLSHTPPHLTVPSSTSSKSSPLSPPSIQVLSQIRSLTASLFGIAAGILGLESGAGFVFYFLGTLFVSELVTRVLAAGKPERFFENVWSELALKDVFGGLMSFVLTWTLFFGLVRS